MSEARAEILDRVRRALGSGAEVPDVPRDYRLTGEYDAAQRRELLTDRLVDYHAQVVPCADRDQDIAMSIERALGEQQVRSVIAPEAVAQAWLTGLAAGPEVQVVVDDRGVRTTDLAGIDAVVTGCALAIAETGVIVLDSSPRCGRRAISLVPDVHVCVVRSEQLVGLPPEAIALLDPSRPQTWIAGPSATSDIELSRVEGVHGPRTLVVVLAG